MAVVYEQVNKLVAAWIPTKDYAMLQQLASTNNLSIAAYVRAIITDAICEETFTNQLKASNTSIQLTQDCLNK